MSFGDLAMGLEGLSRLRHSFMYPALQRWSHHFYLHTVLRVQCVSWVESGVQRSLVFSLSPLQCANPSLIMVLHDHSMQGGNHTIHCCREKESSYKRQVTS